MNESTRELGKKERPGGNEPMSLKQLFQWLIAYMVVIELARRGTEMK